MRLDNDDQRALRAACREVLADYSASGRVRKMAGSDDGFDGRLWKEAADLGWPALAVPTHFGGLGGSAADLCILAEELGWFGQPSPLPQTLCAASVIAAHGQRALLDGVLPAVATGHVRLSWAVGEPGTALEMRLDPVPGGYLLRGVHGFVPDAQVATHFLVAALLDGTRAVALVPAAAAGLAYEPMTTIDITRRYGRVSCSDVRVEEAALLGDAAVGALLNLGVVLQCAENVGIASRLLEMTVKYAGERTQFGRPIGSFQAIKHRIADMLVEREAARVSTRQAAEVFDRSPDDSDEAVSAAKSVAAAAASFVASHALQIHGGIGFTWEHGLHLYLRRAKANELLLGTTRWHNERIVAGLERLGRGC